MSLNHSIAVNMLEIIHGLPYEEAIEKEHSQYDDPFDKYLSHCCLGEVSLQWQYYAECKICLQSCNAVKAPLPLTLDRVLESLKPLGYTRFEVIYDNDAWKYKSFISFLDDTIIIPWELTGDNGKSLTVLKQSDDTKEKIYSIFDLWNGMLERKTS